MHAWFWWVTIMSLRMLCYDVLWREMLWRKGQGHKIGP